MTPLEWLIVVALIFIAETGLAALGVTAAFVLVERWQERRRERRRRRDPWIP